MDNMRKTGLNVYVYEFSIDYQPFNPVDVSKAISTLHKYLMTNYNIK